MGLKIIPAKRMLVALPTPLHCTRFPSKYDCTLVVRFLYHPSISSTLTASLLLESHQPLRYARAPLAAHLLTAWAFLVSIARSLDTF